MMILILVMKTNIKINKADIEFLYKIFLLDFNYFILKIKKLN